MIPALLLLCGSCTKISMAVLDDLSLLLLRAIIDQWKKKKKREVALFVVVSRLFGQIKMNWGRRGSKNRQKSHYLSKLL